MNVNKLASPDWEKLFHDGNFYNKSPFEKLTPFWNRIFQDNCKFLTDLNINVVIM